MRARAMFGLFLMILGAVHVGTAESPRLQAARRAAPAACRTGPATYRIVTKGPGGFTATVEGRCTFDRAAVEGTCTNEYSDTRGGGYRTVSVTRHSTIADVVDEVSVIPPLQLSLGTTTTITGAGANSTNVSTTEYDAQKRLLSVVAESRPSGQRSVTTYSTWDAAGRPTMATVLAGRQTSTISMSYDETGRSQSTTSNGVTCTQTFDANGNPSLGTCPGSTATNTVLTTQQICKG